MKKFDVHLLVNAEQLANMTTLFTDCIVTVSENIAFPGSDQRTRRAKGPRVGAKTKLQTTKVVLNGETAKSTLVAWVEAKRYVNPFTRDALSKNVARALVKAGYKKTSTSAAISDLLRKGAITAVEA